MGLKKKSTSTVCYTSDCDYQLEWTDGSDFVYNYKHFNVEASMNDAKCFVFDWLARDAKCTVDSNEFLCQYSCPTQGN